MEMSAGERVVGSSIARGAFVTGPVEKGKGKRGGGGEEINLRRMLKGKVMEAYQKGDAKVNDLHTLKGRCILTCRFSTKLKPPILAR